MQIGVVMFCPLELIILLKASGVIKCRESAKCMQMWPSLFHTCSQCEQQPAAKIRRVPHVLPLCNLSSCAVTSNLLITLLCPTCSFTASPIQRVAGGHLCAQECVFVSVARAVYWRLSFMFYLLRAAAVWMHFLTSGKVEGWNAARQPGGGSCVCEQTPHQQPASGLTSHWAAPELHAAPEQLLSSSVNKSKLRCNVRSNSIYVGYSNKRTRGKETKWSGEGAAPILFLNELVWKCLFGSVDTAPRNTVTT